MASSAATAAARAGSRLATATTRPVADAWIAGITARVATVPGPSTPQRNRSADGTNGPLAPPTHRHHGPRDASNRGKPAPRRAWPSAARPRAPRPFGGPAPDRRPADRRRADDRPGYDGTDSSPRAQAPGSPGGSPRSRRVGAR